MKRAVFVLLLLGGITYSVPSLSQKAADCTNAINVTATVVNTTNAELANGRIELKAKPGTSLDLYKFFLTRVGSDNTVLGNKDGFKDLKSGQYDLYIIDGKGCSKQIQVQVK